jgi:hypothetical protein
VNIAIEKAKGAWEEANRILQEAQKANLSAPTTASKKAVVAAANHWERAASTWSAAITAGGDGHQERAAFVTATTLGLSTGGRMKKTNERWATFTPLSGAECDAVIKGLSPELRARARKVRIGDKWTVATFGEEGRVAILLTSANKTNSL